VAKKRKKKKTAARSAKTSTKKSAKEPIQKSAKKSPKKPAARKKSKKAAGRRPAGLVPKESLAALDPRLDSLLAREAARQDGKLVFIASESIAPPAVREAMASALTNLYAEGYAHPRLRRNARELAREDAWQLAHYRRYGDRRYYKGVEVADLVEAEAELRCAALFATDDVPAEEIFVNVQPLSGAAANNAVYEAFVEPGETVMGMTLSGGGHLTHGSPANRSGKRHRIASYAPGEDGRLDYDAIIRMARFERPRMIIAGYSAYPWSVDWSRFREAADAAAEESGRPCILLADIAHTAGLVAAGANASPLPFADVVSFTTHKTLCGPRGAVLLSTDPEKAKRLDAAVFPGEQGGPHVHVIAAKAAAFGLARAPEFRALMERVAANARSLAAGFERRGLALAYGGTDTHLCLVDLKSVRGETRVPLSGEIASRVLDLAGVVCNKNTILGDENAVHPSGLRFGTTWVTQRGLGEGDMDAIAGVVARVLREVRTFEYAGRVHPTRRGKLPFGLLAEARGEVEKIARRAARVEGAKAPAVPKPDAAALAEARAAAKRAKLGRVEVLEVAGPRARYALQELAGCDVLALKAGEAARAAMLGPDGALLAAPVLVRREADDHGRERLLLLAGPADAPRLALWLESASDGYLVFDEAMDLDAKVQGPFTVRRLGAVSGGAKGKLHGASIGPGAPAVGTPVETLLDGHAPLFDPAKPYFAGIGRVRAVMAAPSAERARWIWAESRLPVRRTPLAEAHAALGARMAEFAGWEMPLWYSSIGEEHAAVRRACGLFDVAHMGGLLLEGPGAERFLDLVFTNDAARLAEGESAYGYLLAPDGTAVDDVIVYRLASDAFHMVVNAGNAEHARSHLEALAGQGPPVGGALVDPAYPAARLDADCRILDLRSDEAGPRACVSLALQGRRALEVLGRVAPGPSRRRIEKLDRGRIAPAHLAGHVVRVARTGYTGEEVGFELYVHPERARPLWEELLAEGAPLGLAPCGLGARDSLRTEAGLPLFWHEIEGPERISPHGAGFGNFIKTYKTFFVGRGAYLRREESRTHEIVRFCVPREGVRPVRPAAELASSDGTPLGTVTSCAFAGRQQVGLAYVRRALAPAGAPVLVRYPVRAEAAGPPPATGAVVFPRFAPPEELELRWNG